MEALDILKEREIAVIVSDLGMPAMRGTEFLRRAKVASPDTVRIILTGYTDPNGASDAARESDLYECIITKPWDDNQLVMTVRDAIEQYRHKR